MLPAERVRNAKLLSERMRKSQFKKQSYEITATYWNMRLKNLFISTFSMRNIELCLCHANIV